VSAAVGRHNAGRKRRIIPFFTGEYERLVIPDVGHNPPQEAPRDFAEAILSLI